MTKKNVHVVPRKNNGLNWAVKSAGSQKAASVHKNKPDAMAAAKQIAQNNSSERIEHNKGGVIVGKDSFGNDPRETKG